MNTDCENCKHARKWSDKEKLEYLNRFFNLLGYLPEVGNHYFCDKIAEGTEWHDNGKTYTYDGHSLEGENYDEVFGCFEPKEDL